jgi:hypothetical protein
MIDEDKWVYTWMGYGKVSEYCKGKVIVELVWGCKFYVSPASIFSTICFSVKSFGHNKRLLDFQWGLTQDFSTLFAGLYKQLSIGEDLVIHLYMPKGQLAEVNETDTPFKLRMKMGSKLIAIAKARCN